MSDVMWLSKAELKRGLPIAKLLQPGPAMQVAASHHLVWSLFGDHAERKRDFLYRELKPGVFYCLSRRQPEDPHGLFDLYPPKEFNPQLKKDDCLEFSMCVNATKSIPVGRNMRSRRADVVMALKKEIGEEEMHRRDLEHRAALSWFEAQGGRYGFSFDWTDDVDEVSDVKVLGYEVQRVSRQGRSQPSMGFGVLELAGRITVEKPEAFLPRLRQGFGRSKGFGCGLMLIRRVSRQGVR